MAPEIELLRRAIDADVPVLGLCFGGQALARALGASVAPAPTPEIGWMRVETDEPRLIPPGPWLEFHYEVFDVPSGAREPARSAVRPQAFALGPHLGTQFHPEMTPEIVDDWARRIEARLTPFGVVDRRTLLEAGRRCAPEAARQAERLFYAWWSRAAYAASDEQDDHEDDSDDERDNGNRASVHGAPPNGLEQRSRRPY